MLTTEPFFTTLLDHLSRDTTMEQLAATLSSTCRKLVLLAILLAAGCCRVSVQEYRDEKPELSVERFFSGKLEAIGIVVEASGKVVKRFTCDMRGTFDGTQLTLEEDFTWSDNTKQKRTWILKKQPDGTFTGTAADVVGQAKAEVAGNTFHLTYDLEVPIDGSTTVLHVDDWLYLVTESVLINRSKLSKFGIKAAEVILTIRKLS